MATATVAPLWVYDLESLRHQWGWLLVLGIGMVVLGFVALSSIFIATLATVIVLAWLTIIAGVMELVQAFRAHRWRGSLLHSLVGIAGILIGLLVLTHPGAGALGWTLLFSTLFSVVGIFRVVAAATLKFPHWKWALFDGIVTLALGIILWVSWPVSGLWFLGLAVAISLLLRGWSAIMLAIGIRTLPAPEDIKMTCNKCGETSAFAPSEIFGNRKDGRPVAVRYRPAA